MKKLQSILILKTMKNLIVFFGVISVLLMSSCEKSLHESDANHNNLVGANLTEDIANYKIIEGIMSFDNPLNLEKAIRDKFKMSPEERISKEKSEGFKSLWRATDEAFNIISEPQNITEVNEFLKSYGDLVELIENNGEKYIQERVSSKSLSFIANVDGVFIMGDNVCKVIDDYILEASIDEIDEVLRLSHRDLNNIVGNSDYKIQNTLAENNFKTGCGTADEDYQTSSDEKYKVKTVIEIISYYLSGYQYADVEQTTTNYKKTLGIWFKNKADLAQAGSFSISYIHNGNSGTESTSAYINGWDVNEIDYLRYCVTIQGYASDWVCWFYSYSAWGSSSEVDRGNATVSCN